MGGSVRPFSVDKSSGALLDDACPRAMVEQIQIRRESKNDFFMRESSMNGLRRVAGNWNLNCRIMAAAKAVVKSKAVRAAGLQRGLC
jgi:hypothetical protein